MKKIFFATVWCFLCVHSFSAADSTADTSVYAQASARFADAMHLRAESADSALVFSEAARLFETAASDNWRVYFEAGNARWWAGDIALSIIAYRRYLAHDPFNVKVWHNLVNARELAGTVPPTQTLFLGWPFHVWLASGAAFLAGCAMLLFSLFLFYRHLSVRKASIIVCCCALVAAVSCAGTVLLSRPVAVVLTETQGRKGDSNIYAPLPRETLKSGQEVVLLGTRDTWSRILVGSVECWVPTASLESIQVTPKN